MIKIILASQSPRRKNILKQIGVNFKIETSNYKEKIDNKLTTHKQVQKFSLEKAKAVSKKHTNGIVIAADTLVTINGKIIGKPKDKKDAKRILKLLSGKIHIVVSGFTVMNCQNGKSITKSVETKVRMRKLTEKEIDDYIKTGEPLDKAGAYGIQEKGGALIQEINGDYFNVVGLPLGELIEVLKEFGIDIAKMWK